MIAKDLLTALNDIDPKLLEDVEPWGAAPKTIRRHPVWAVAAALALCLGIGTAVVLLTGQLSLVSPEGSMMVAEDSAQTVEVPDIQYEEVSSEDWIMQDFETWDYPEITLHRPLTQEETALMAAQELLPEDMDFAYLGGEAGVDDQGQTHYVTFEGWREIGEQYRASGCAFRIAVAPDGIPSSPAGKILHVLDGPNNEIDGVEIYAANMTLSTSTAISGKIGDSYTTTDYCLGFLLEGDQPLGVTIQSIYCHDNLPGSFDTAEDAQYFAAYVLQQILEKGISTEGISGREPEGTYNSPYIFDYAQDMRTVEATPPEDASSRELTTSEIANLLGYEEWWATSLFSTIDFSGSVVYDSSRALWQASFTGYQHGTDIPVIHMAAAPGGLPPCCQTGDVPWNNQLGNTPIYSASQKDGEEETFSAQAVIGSGEDAVGVYLDIVSDGVFFRHGVRPVVPLRHHAEPGAGWGGFKPPYVRYRLPHPDLCGEPGAGALHGLGCAGGLCHPGHDPSRAGRPLGAGAAGPSRGAHPHWAGGHQRDRGSHPGHRAGLRKRGGPKPGPGVLLGAPGA